MREIKFFEGKKVYLLVWVMATKYLTIKFGNSYACYFNTIGFT